jgi:hypothetical protein
MKDELPFQRNDALSLLDCLQDGGEISDYAPGPCHGQTAGRVYCIGQDGTLKDSFPRETLDWLESERLVEPRRVSPPLGPEGLTAEQMERSHDWEIVGFSITEDGAKFLRSRQRNP